MVVQFYMSDDQNIFDKDTMGAFVFIVLALACLLFL